MEKWGDPCSEKDVKWLQVQAQCDGTEHIYHSLKIDTVIPVNSQANLHIPTYDHKAVQIWEGSVDNKKASAAAVHVADVNGDKIKVQFGSGSYSFVVKENN